MDKIAKCCHYRNFPFHLELRVKGDKIIPIELNPMRLCGWCITDIAYCAWGINVYEYFLNRKIPDWKAILSKSDNSYYYFTIGENPKAENFEIDYYKYLKNISNPLDIRKIEV